MRTFRPVIPKECTSPLINQQIFIEQLWLPVSYHSLRVCSLFLYALLKPILLELLSTFTALCDHYMPTWPILSLG